MLRFRNQNSIPPSGFTFIDPDTGMNINARSFSQWTTLIRLHRQANNLAPISDADAMHQNCLRLSPQASASFCESDQPVNTVDSVNLSIGDVIRGTLVLASFKLAGSPLVSREQAEARAAICVACPFNAPYKKTCGGDCQELVDLVKSIIGNEGTALDDRLQACGVCRCSNKSQVWIPVEQLRHGVTKFMMDEFPKDTCWKVKELLALTE